MLEFFDYLSTGAVEISNMVYWLLRKCVFFQISPSSKAVRGTMSGTGVPAFPYPFVSRDQAGMGWLESVG